jgi:hypothetical protein
MAEEELRVILMTVKDAITMVLNILKQVPPERIKKMPVDKCLEGLSALPLTLAKIKLKKIEVSKEIILPDYGKTSLDSEIVPVKWLNEIKKNVRLLINIDANTLDWNHQVVVLLYIDENEEVKLEQFWFDIIPVKTPTQKIKEMLERAEKYAQHIIPYVLIRLIEELIRHSKQGATP